MRVYRVRLLDKTQDLIPEDKNLVARWKPDSLGRGEPYSGQWNALKLQRFIPPRGSGNPRKLHLGDISSILSSVEVPLFSAAAEELMRKELGIEKQWLEVDFPEKSYKLLNLTNKVDAADLDACVIRRYSDGTISGIKSWAFRPEVVEKQTLFKDSTKSFNILCTDQFIEFVRARKLTGFYFDLIWDSRFKPFPVIATRAEMESRPEVFGPDGIRPL